MARHRKQRIALAAFAIVIAASAADATSRADAGAPRGRTTAPTARVGPGTYHPFYPPTEAERDVPVPAFELDRFPVTNAEYLAFVLTSPKWRRDRVSRLFADESYLAHWGAPDALGDAVDPQQPVVRVSWFAAKAYCAARGARLPREAEWELAALASDTAPDGRSDPVYRARVLDGYSRPTPARLATIGRGAPNVWGVHDLHGLVWEWVLDFNSSLVVSDAREGGDKDRLRFCGVGALSATDTADYASFMRIAFRSSLRADFTTKNLGFRCAKDAGEEPK